MPYTTLRYQDGNKKVPYTEWIRKLRKKIPALPLRLTLKYPAHVPEISGITNLKGMVSGHYELITGKATAFIIRWKLDK